MPDNVILNNHWYFTRACIHFKNGDKNEINCCQTRKTAQIISGY